MSKRYGRNQKRKHQARIAALEGALKRSEGALEEAENVCRSLGGDLARLHRALNSVTPYTAFLPPKHTTYDPHYLRCSPFQIAEMPRLDLNALGEDDPSWTDALCPELRQIPVFLVETHIQQHPEEFATIIHFVAAGGGHKFRSAYAVSTDALAMDRHYGQLVEGIVRECVADLTEKIYKKRERLGAEPHSRAPLNLER